MKHKPYDFADIFLKNKRLFQVWKVMFKHYPKIMFSLTSTKQDFWQSLQLGIKYLRIYSDVHSELFWKISFG